MNRHATRGRRLGALGQLLLSAAALLAVTAGIPWGLVASAGMPWPSPATSLPDLAERLTEPISDPFLIKLLALIAWTCWAAFMATLVREACWALRQLPILLRDLTEIRIRLDALPTHRAAAGFLVATVVFALATMWRPATAHAHTTTVLEPRPATAVTAPAVPGARAAGPSHRAEAPDHVATYTVEPGDTLWDIARTHLGDPLRWPVIYQLNCHRTQPDGGRLRDPDSLRPGWLLHLPAPAALSVTRPGRPVPPPHPAPAAPVQQPAAQAPAAPGPADVPHRTTPAPHSRPRPSAPSAAPARRGWQPGGVRIGIGPASAIGITTAAGIAAAVAFARAHERRRRTPDLTAQPAPLAQAVRAARGAYLTANQPQEAEPAPSEAEETAAERPAPARPAAPGTVVCADTDGQELALDVLAVPGGIALTGPGADAAARALAIAVLGAGERLRPAVPPVRLITPAATAERLFGEAHRGSLPAWEVTKDLPEALTLVDQALLHRARLMDTQAAPGTETHAVDEAGLPPMDVLICDHEPQHAARLVATAQQALSGRLAAVVLNPGTWTSQLLLAEDGSVTRAIGPAAEPLGHARMFTLAPGPACELLDVLHAAHGRTAADRAPRIPIPPPTCVDEPPAPANPPPQAGTTPNPAAAAATADADQSSPSTEEGDAAASAELPTGQPPRGTPQDPGSSTGHQENAPAKPITVHVLGRFRIVASGSEKEFGHRLREGAREFIMLLAAYPKGVRSSEIMEELRLPSDPEEAGRELANLRRAVRRVLRQASGLRHAAFVIRAGDRHLLDRNLVATDIDVFTAAVQKGAARHDQTARIAALNEAVAAYAGPFCEGPGCAWADELRESLHRKAVDALVQLADHAANAAFDADAALALLDQAAEWDLYNEAVYQRIIRLQCAIGRDDAAHRTYAVLKRRLAALGVPPDPETTTLLQGGCQPADAAQATSDGPAGPISRTPSRRGSTHTPRIGSPA